MSDTTELNDKLVSELREMAKSLGIAEAEDLRKPQLISRIVEQNQLIEAARAQQNAVENNYSEIKPSAPAVVAESAERTRKRIRTTKTTNNQPRVEVPLDDTNLFDLQDDEPQQEESESLSEEIAKPVIAEDTGEQREEPGTRTEDVVAEPRPQKFERRNPNQQQKNQEPAINLDFDNVIVNEGVLESMPDGYGFLRTSD